MITRKAMTNKISSWLFSSPDFPILSTIPNLLHAFSVHLMNCYFPDFWYSHVTEKRTSEGRNAICEKSRITVSLGDWKSVFLLSPPWFSGNDFPYKVRRAPAISDKCPPFHFFVHFLLIITQYCMNSYFLNSSECVPNL